MDVHPAHCHGQADEFRYARAGRPTAEKKKALIGEFPFGDAQRGEDAGQCHAGGALDVVV